LPKLKYKYKVKKLKPIALRFLTFTIASVPLITEDNDPLKEGDFLLSVASG
jgi:hypothetical protein